LRQQGHLELLAEKQRRLLGQNEKEAPAPEKISDVPPTEWRNDK